MKPPIYGLLAEFETPEQLLSAAERAHADGFRAMDAYSPMPVEGLSEAVGLHRSRVPLVTLVGGILGACTAWGLQAWINQSAYPVNVGGRPYLSWPAFIVVTFELTILFAGIAAVFGMITMNGLPLPYHPVFNVERFAAASRDKFFLCIEAADPQFDLHGTREFLASLGPVAVEEVPN